MQWEIFAKVTCSFVQFQSRCMRVCVFVCLCKCDNSGKSFVLSLVVCSLFSNEYVPLYGCMTETVNFYMIPRRPNRFLHRTIRLQPFCASPFPRFFPSPTIRTTLFSCFESGVVPHGHSCLVVFVALLFSIKTWLTPKNAKLQFSLAITSLLLTPPAVKEGSKACLCSLFLLRKFHLPLQKHLWVVYPFLLTC